MQDLKQSNPLPSAAVQLQFLKQIQQLIQLAEITSTYKFALLISITRLAIEKGDNSSNALTLQLEDVAEKFIELYWHQTKPLEFGENSTIILRQNNGSQAKILTLLQKVQENFSTLAALRQSPKAWQKLKNETVKIIHENPLHRLQIIKREPQEFLYKTAACTPQSLTLLPNVMFCLRQFNVIIEELCQKFWVDAVRINKFNSDILLGLPDLETFLFEFNRNQLKKVGHVLMDIQQNQCFYCGKKLSDKNAAVDHFIPWSLYPSDTGHNFVLADSTCNGQKSNFLAEVPFYERWQARNHQHNEIITQEIGALGFLTDFDRSHKIAAWAYQQAQENHYKLWDLKK